MTREEALRSAIADLERQMASVNDPGKRAIAAREIAKLCGELALLEGAARRNICAACARETLPFMVASAFVPGANLLPAQIIVDPPSNCPWCQGWTDLQQMLRKRANNRGE